MTYVSYLPSPPLNAYIDDLYYFEGPAPYPRQKVLPFASSNLMINLGQPFQVFRPEEASPFIYCTESWWSGIWNTYHIVEWPSTVRFFGVHFKPSGAYPFLRFPLSEMNSQVVQLDAIWARFAGALRERLYEAMTIEAGFAQLERFLLARLNEAPRSLSMVQHAMTEIGQHYGVLSIHELSDQLGVSQNHLRIQFNRLVGIPPKEVARLFRFTNVLRLIDSEPSADLTLITYQAQFYDQSHLYKDFVAFAGSTPSEYVRLRRRVEVESPEHARAHHNLPVD